MPKPRPIPKDYDLSSLNNYLARIPRQHRSEVDEFIAFKRSQGVKNGTLRNYGLWMLKWCQFSERPLGTVKKTDVSSFFARLRAEGYGNSMISQSAILLKAYYAWRFLDESRPPSFWAAFPTKPPRDRPRPTPPTEDEINRLLAHAWTLRDKTLIAVLADSGFRVSELIALNVGSVAFDDDKRTTWLSIPKEGYRLKTGPREVPVARSTPFLREHLASHRLSGDAEAPLFYSCTRKREPTRMTRFQCEMVLRRVSERAGTRRIWPHLLRHKRATDAARRDWNEGKMRLFFGWAPGSKMPSHYSHLNRNDLQAQVLADTARVPSSAEARAAQERPSSDQTTAVALTALAEILKRLAQDAPRSSNDEDSSPAPVATVP